VAKERAKTKVKEKDKDERMEKKTHQVAQKLYETIPEVPIVVKIAMEEKVQMIGEFIKGF
jgi:hypothetical protein